eukprot:7142118-Prymnesium_polylepis.5
MASKESLDSHMRNFAPVRQIERVHRAAKGELHRRDEGDAAVGEEVPVAVAVAVELRQDRHAAVECRSEPQQVAHRLALRRIQEHCRGGGSNGGGGVGGGGDGGGGGGGSARCA